MSTGPNTDILWYICDIRVKTIENRCLGQAVMTLRLPCAIVESPRRHKRVPFVNFAFLRSRSIKRRQWKLKLDYYGVVFAQLAAGCGITAKDPSGLDSDWWQRSPKWTSYSPKPYFSLVGQVTVTWHSSDGRADNKILHKWVLFTSDQLTSGFGQVLMTCYLSEGRVFNFTATSGWIPHSRCCENPARAKSLAGFSRHLSAGFTDLNPAPRGLSL